MIVEYGLGPPITQAQAPQFALPSPPEFHRYVELEPGYGLSVDAFLERFAGGETPCLDGLARLPWPVRPLVNELPLRIALLAPPVPLHADRTPSGAYTTSITSISDQRLVVPLAATVRTRAK
ncbi:MAG: hypothetical protein GYB64_14440 [Chloroflexi bacterium]|nr:hypothetical protein [Chloroflexota bacterium]